MQAFTIKIYFEIGEPDKCFTSLGKTDGSTTKTTRVSCK